MNTQSSHGVNRYVAGSLPRLYLTTATPIILIMVTNGLFTVVDALFLGIFVGADALTAVTLMFPGFMLIIALSALVGGGMASVLARQLGAARMDDAANTLFSAQVLALVVSGGLIVLFIFTGRTMTEFAANHDPKLTELGYQYIYLLIYLSPLTFILSVQGDALRSEGHVGVMSLIAVSSVGLNIIFNYILIVELEMGVFGSALGSVLAQAVSLSVVLTLRLSGRTNLGLFVKPARNLFAHWGEMLTLGLPPSLNFLGVSIISAVVIYAIQTWARESYPETVAAFGIINRIMTFVFLPLLGLNLASQSIVGNNFGAGAFGRSNMGLKIALVSAVVYCLVNSTILVFAASAIGGIFVEDAKVVAEVGRILPIIIFTFVFFGIATILSGYFQAIGDARRAALLGLTRTYLFAIPATLCLPFLFGEWGIWYATPVSDVAMMVLTAGILWLNRRRTGARYGLFISAPAN